MNDDAAVLTEKESAPPKLFTFTVEDAYAIDETGIFRGERVELVGGQFIVKEPGLPPHSGMVNRLVDWFRERPKAAPVLHVQNPLHVSAIDLPQPDLTILRKRHDLYETSHPEPGDVLLVIEVANTSLRYDQSTKASLYAAAGIRTYWIVDVNAQTIRVYTEPADGAYKDVQTLSRGDSLTVPTPQIGEEDPDGESPGQENIRLPVADLFPTPRDTDAHPGDAHSDDAQ